MSNLIVSQDGMPFLKEKCIVDLINTIDVTHDHIEQQKNRNTSIKKRIFDSITGHSQLRQIEINQSVMTSLKSAQQLIDFLTTDVTHLTNAVTFVTKKLDNVQSNIIKLASFTKNFQLEFKQFVEQTHSRFELLDKKIQRINIEQRVDTEINASFEYWEAQRLNNYLPAERCYLTLERLSWGVTGYFYNHQETSQQEKDSLKERIINKVIIQMQKDLGQESTKFVNISKCISFKPNDSLVYASDWSDEYTPFTYAINGNQTNHLSVMPTIARMSEQLMNEVFDDKYTYYLKMVG